MKFVIIGLGNPGKKYERTRHNAGFMAVDQLGRRLGISISQEKHHAFVGKGVIGAHEAILAKPQTYMNESGRSAAALLRDAYLTAGALIVLHDELDLPLGAVRVKTGGGHGGHNGLRSIIEHLGTADFIRIRIGIGRPAPGMDTADYVLSPFLLEERDAADRAVSKAAVAVAAIVSEDVTKAMNLFNQK
jgi:peptidyl-tRNA hydrolase, PTH1 family